MCGFFALSAKTENVEKLVPGLKINSSLPDVFRYGPGSNILAVLNDGEIRTDFFRWGLIPSWTKDLSKLSVIFNARSESVNEKPTFKNSFKNRRCLIPADEYFEWKKIPGSKKKSPYSVKMQNKETFTLAGIWDLYKAPSGENILSATVLTCNPNPLISEIHDRMPVIISQENRLDWLDINNKDSEYLNSLLNPYPESLMSLEPIYAVENNENTLFS